MKNYQLAPLVYDYENPLAFLRDYYSYLKTHDPEFSVRKWSKRMHLKNSKLLVRILKSECVIRPSYSDFIEKAIDLDVSEKSYFHFLIKFYYSKETKEKNSYQLMLNFLSPSNDSYSILRTEKEDLFSSWLNMAILSLSKVKDFSLVPINIQKALKKDLGLDEIEQSLEYLKKEKFLIVGAKGKLEKAAQRITTKTDVCTPSVGAYYSQVSELAKDSIETPVHLREFQCFSFSIKKDQIPQVKEMIRQFRNSLASVISEDGEEVYQTNLQFFPLTEIESCSDPSL